MTDRSDGPAAYSDVESTMRPPLVTGLELGRLVVEPFLLPRADGGHPLRVVRVVLHAEGLVVPRLVHLAIDAEIEDLTLQNQARTIRSWLVNY